MVGDETNGDLVSFDHFEHLGEVPARYAVPVPIAMDAAAEFFLYGRPSAELRWEED